MVGYPAVLYMEWALILTHHSVLAEHGPINVTNPVRIHYRLGLMAQVGKVGIA